MATSKVGRKRNEAKLILNSNQNHGTLVAVDVQVKWEFPSNPVEVLVKWEILLAIFDPFSCSLRNPLEIEQVSVVENWRVVFVSRKFGESH